MHVRRVVEIRDNVAQPPSSMGRSMLCSGNTHAKLLRAKTKKGRENAPPCIALSRMAYKQSTAGAGGRSRPVLA